MLQELVDNPSIALALIAFGILLLACMVNRTTWEHLEELKRLKGDKDAE